jgi:dTDP-4-amino-4,6-dideoxygalactose transaminase
MRETRRPPTEQIRLFAPRFRVEECLAEIRGCLEAGWPGLGYKTIEFEEAWKRYAGLTHAHFVNSCTAGLHLALEVLKRRRGWEDGDEVISTPFTFVSTNHAILHTRLRPVFADIDASLCLDPDDVARRITPRTRAVVFVGLAGNVGRYDKVLQVCREHGLALALDAAHMAGTRFRGRHVGHDADAAAFSFHAVKNLPTGDSGMVCFRDADDDGLARKLSWMGIDKDTFTRVNTPGTYPWQYDVEAVGFKYHGNSIMAAVGLVQLRYLDRDNAYRRQIARWYDEALAGHPQSRPIPITEGCESARHLYQIRVRERDALLRTLNEHGVFPGVHYLANTHYPMYADGAGRCPEAEAASEEVMSLPLHLALTREHVDYVCDLLLEHAA